MAEIYDGKEGNTKATTDEDWYPLTKHKPLPPIRTDGDMSYCPRCNAKTVYLGTGCAVCSVPTGDFRLRYSGQAYKYMLD